MRKIYPTFQACLGPQWRETIVMETHKSVLRGELALVVAVIINSLGVKLMLHSGSGISAISSVPYAFSLVFPFLTMGTWTYIFQGVLVASLMVMRKRFVWEYLLSFVVGFFFGIMIDLHEMWIPLLPLNLPLRVVYFCLSYIIICIGIAICNRCKTPIIPTDLFPREVSEIFHLPYSRVKITFDVTCLLVTALMTFLCLGRVMGLGVGTVLAAFTMGKGVSLAGVPLDRHVRFVSIFEGGAASRPNTVH